MFTLQTPFQQIYLHFLGTENKEIYPQFLLTATEVFLDYTHPIPVVMATLECF